MRPGGFYAIVDVPGVAEALALAVAQLDGGARVLQVRLKAAPARDILAVARALRPLTRDAGVPLVVNDRLDLALAAGADAVHLGQDDLPLGAAREVVRAAGARLAIGVSTSPAGRRTGFPAAGCGRVPRARPPGCG